MAQFNSLAFVFTFDKVLDSLQQSEKITKATLLTLSRDLLLLLHTQNTKQGDIGYINRVINVLTPVNRRAFLAFCKEFTGFILNEDGTMFLKKSKKHYEEVAERAIEWLNDPHNNIWTWSETRLTVEAVPTPFNAEYVKKQTAALLKKADKAGMSQAELMGAIFDAGFTIDSIMLMLEQHNKLDDMVQRIEDTFEIVKG